MSIRMIARELYAFQKSVERLEEELSTAPLEKQADLRDRLRKARAEMGRMRQILNGHKDADR